MNIYTETFNEFIDSLDPTDEEIEDHELDVDYEGIMDREDDGELASDNDPRSNV